MFENLLKGGTKQTSVSGPLDKIEEEQNTQGSLIFSRLRKKNNKKNNKNYTQGSLIFKKLCQSYVKQLCLKVSETEL